MGDPADLVRTKGIDVHKNDHIPNYGLHAGDNVKKAI